MKIRDIRCGWSAEGKHIATLPANHPAPHEALALFYGLRPDDRNYENYQRPIEFDRAVLQKDSGGFVIVPLNPEAFEVL